MGVLQHMCDGEIVRASMFQKHINDSKYMDLDELDLNKILFR